ncbi:MAG: hypothetical protein WBG50_11195 [Desulfomonilaceae bacterium]
MRKEYGKALREVFTQELKVHLPQFLPVKISSLNIFPGERGFRWVPAEPTHFWIILCPDQKGHEAFTVELGWSRLGRFPELGMRPSSNAPSENRDEFALEEYVCRLGMLMTGGDLWWHLENPLEHLASQETYMAYLQQKVSPISQEEATRIVRPRAEDAVEKLRLYAVPYLEEAHRFR